MSSTEKIPNLNYEADIKYMLRYTRYFLSILGLWPMVTQNTSQRVKHISKILILTWLISPSVMLVPLAHYMILRERNMIARIVLIAPLAFFFGSFVKYVFIVFRCGMIKLCIQHVTTDWMMIGSEKERATMKRNVKVGHDVTIICSIFMYGCGMFYNTVMPFWSEKVLNEFNETMRPLAYPGYDRFVDANKSPNYEIMFCTITFAVFITLTVNVTACNLAAIFVTHACGQLQILILRLGRIVEEVNKSRSNERLRLRISFLVRFHVRVLSIIAKKGTSDLSMVTKCYVLMDLYDLEVKILFFSQRLASIIELVLREICLVEIVVTTFILCLVEYCFMKELDNSGVVGMITYSVSLMSLCFNIYIFCYIGELLKDHYHLVGQATYMIEWYRLPGKIGLDMVMIIIMANCPRKITAGGMIELTISTFGSIIQMSMTYFNMLRQLTS